MKKILFLMALVMPLILASCGDDKDVLSPMEQDLVGEWALVKTPGSQTDDYHYVFKKERTGSRRHIVDGQVVTDIAFNWTLDGNTLTLNYAGQQLVMEIALKVGQMQVTYLATGAVENYNRVTQTDDEQSN